MHSIHSLQLQDIKYRDNTNPIIPNKTLSKSPITQYQYMTRPVMVEKLYNSQNIGSAVLRSIMDQHISRPEVCQFRWTFCFIYLNSLSIVTIIINQKEKKNDDFFVRE